jgi:enoyl-CoA hydratase/carnithine racemase
MTPHTMTEINDGVMVLTLNRPEKLNAYTAQMGDEIAFAFEQASENDDVRVIIVTGAGRGFCAGADISGGTDSFGADAAHVFGGQSAPKASKHFIDAIFSCKKPSIAAINGAAVGVGITLTLPMDIRLVAEGAKLGFIFTRRGLVPEAGSAWFLPKLVGVSQALRWCLSGAMIGPQEALAAGLVSEVVPSEGLLDKAHEIARDIADNTAPVATAITRQMLWRYAGEDSPMDLVGFDAAINRKLGASPDVAEGVQAFIEKRAPKFPGKASSDIPAQFPWERDKAK